MDDNGKMVEKDLKENNPEDQNTDTHETNGIHYSGAFLPIGIGLGVAFGIVFDNLAIGISLGVALGLGVGAAVAFTKKKKKDQ